VICLVLGLIVGYMIAPKEKELHSYDSGGDFDKLAGPISCAVDGDWSTKVEWNTTQLGDFNVYVIENFTIPNTVSEVRWEFKAYHRAGGLIPDPMKVSYWDGALWKQLYVLGDTEHANEVFFETLDLPTESFSNGIVSIRTDIRYSSHVVGGLLPIGPKQSWDYVEYFEGKIIMAET
jgi:hypothetical protein